VLDSAYCTVGNVTIDDLVFSDGSTMWEVPGGGAIYAALGIGVWGEYPAVIAPIGPDYPAELLKDRVDLRRCPRREQTLRNWGLYEEDDTRVFVFRSKTPDWRAFCPGLEDLHGLRAKYIHVAPLPWDLQIELAQELRRRGAEFISVDPDEHYLGSCRQIDLRRLLDLTDCFLPSRQDVETLFPGKSPADALRELRSLAPDQPLIAVKCGADGVIMHSAGTYEAIHVPAADAAVVDVTGAGDAFCGGTLAGYARTENALEAILWGIVAASYAVSSHALVDASQQAALEALDSFRQAADGKMETIRL